MKAPKAPKKPHILREFGNERIDNYYWLAERGNREVLAYLEAENTYYQEQTAPTLPLQQQLFTEMKGRMKEDDSSVPYFYNGYWYGTRYEAGKEYPIYFRHKENMTAPEELLFDCNLMAEGYAYFHLESFAISDDNQWVVYAVDTVSRIQYTLQIKHLGTG